MYYYKYNNKYLFSKLKYDEFSQVSKDDFIKGEFYYYLIKEDINKIKRSYIPNSPFMMNLKEEGIYLLNKNLFDKDIDLDNSLKKKLNDEKIKVINTNHKNFMDSINMDIKKEKYEITILGLGDVGGTLLSGLMLLAPSLFSKIKLYDLNLNNCKRWYYEASQIYDAFDDLEYPQIEIIKEDEIFNSDVVIFCISAYIPKVGEKVDDVRMAQFKKNSSIINNFGKMARNNNYKNLFCVVSDPIEPLCKSLYLSSNTNSKDEFDYNGIPSENIIGFGLGVMNARANFYSKNYKESLNFYKEGRAFGSHGKELVIANSITNYNNDISINLTQDAIKANLVVRDVGFKPFIAPALSSGAISIINTLKGKWNYSAIYFKDSFYGCKNKRIKNTNKIESLNLDDDLYQRIKISYENISKII